MCGKIYHSQGIYCPVYKTLPNKNKNKSPYINIVSPLDLHAGHMPDNDSVEEWLFLVQPQCSHKNCYADKMAEKH